jgi:hypothetical protein
MMSSTLTAPPYVPPRSFLRSFFRCFLSARSSSMGSASAKAAGASALVPSAEGCASTAADGGAAGTAGSAALAPPALSLSCLRCSAACALRADLLRRGFFAATSVSLPATLPRFIRL